MKKQAVEFATVTERGVVTKIGRSSIIQPKPKFKGGDIKWAPDKLKPEYQQQK